VTHFISINGALATPTGSPPTYTVVLLDRLVMLPSGFCIVLLELDNIVKLVRSTTLRQVG
jgi:hypothetical protein